MKRFILFSLCILIQTSIFSQQLQKDTSNTNSSSQNQSTSKNTTKELPKGYKTIKLGLSLNETKKQLIDNPEFGYNGDRDVSLTPGDGQILIETDATKGLGSIYLTQCWFQFYEDKLYIITININKNKMDYYTMFKTFSDKYGNPGEIDPTKSVWKNDEVTIVLEKPLTVKYIDTKIYEQILNLSSIDISAEEMSRELFLEEF